LLVGFEGAPVVQARNHVGVSGNRLFS
jgi:hypothetical protein